MLEPLPDTLSGDSPIELCFCFGLFIKILLKGSSALIESLRDCLDSFCLCTDMFFLKPIFEKIRKMKLKLFIFVI